MVESSSFLYTSSHPDKYNNSANRIISKEEEREDIQGEILESLKLILPQEILQLQGSSHAD